MGSLRRQLDDFKLFEMKVENMEKRLDYMEKLIFNQEAANNNLVQNNNELLHIISSLVEKANQLPKMKQNEDDDILTSMEKGVQRKGQNENEIYDRRSICRFEKNELPTNSTPLKNEHNTLNLRRLSTII